MNGKILEISQVDEIFKVLSELLGYMHRFMHIVFLEEVE